jgi:hypothetical protein
MTLAHGLAREEQRLVADGHLYALLSSPQGPAIPLNEQECCENDYIESQLHSRNHLVVVSN